MICYPWLEMVVLGERLEFDPEEVQKKSLEANLPQKRKKKKRFLAHNLDPRLTRRPAPSPRPRGAGGQGWPA